MRYYPNERVRVVSTTDPALKTGDSGKVIGYSIKTGTCLIEWDKGFTLAMLLNRGDVIERAVD